MPGSRFKLLIFTDAEIDHAQLSLVTGMGWDCVVAQPGDLDFPEQVGCIVFAPLLLSQIPAAVLQGLSATAPILVDTTPFHPPTLQALARLAPKTPQENVHLASKLLADLELIELDPSPAFKSLNPEELWEIYQAQRKLLYSITSTSPDFVYLFSRKGEFLYVNARLLEVWGRRFEDCVGKTCLELGYQQWHHEMHMREIEQVINTKKPITGEVEFVAPLTGIFGIYEYVFTPVFDQDGEVAFIAGVTRDVTERKQIEKRLQEKQQLLDVALDASKTGTFRWDPNMDQFISVDATFVKMFALEEYGGALTAGDVGTRVHPEDMHIFNTALEGLFRGEDLETEFRIVLPDGTVTWIYDRGRMIRDENGKLLHVVGACTDITRVKSIEMELRAAERNREFIMESLPQKLFIADASGAILYHNRPWADYTGLSIEQTKTEWHTFIHPADIDYNIATWQKALNNGTLFSIEHRFRNADGEYRWHVSRALPMHDESGEIQLWVGSSTDIHDVKMAQRLLEEREDRLASLNLELQQARDTAVAASTAKSKFLASMSHELRTPLNAIIGYSEMLKDDLTQTGASDMVGDLDKILLSARHLLAVISDILDVSKLEAGKMEFEVQSFDLREVVEEATTLMLPLIEKNENTLESIFPDNGPLVITTDRVRVRQVLFNLLSNAAKFTEKGHISISCARRTSPSGVDFVELAVADSGIGIEEDKIKQLFQEFSQLERRTHPMFGGTGLGLAISRRLCQLLGGEIEVVSEKDKGSVFTVYLPIQFDGTVCRVGDLSVAGG